MSKEQIIRIKSEDEIVQHYKDGIDSQCLVCDEELRGVWTDYNGQIRCFVCGMTYQILGCHLRKEFLDKHGLNENDIAERYCDAFENVELYRAYYGETKNDLPNGFFLGSPPYGKNCAIDFCKWLIKNEARVSGFNDVYDWAEVVLLSAKSEQTGALS